jgi:hypothetical protein
LNPHPEPPADLPERTLPLVARAGPFTRIHRLDKNPLFYGRTRNNRWDAPAEEYGVLYVGLDARTAFIETFGHETGHPFVTRSALAAKGLAEIEASAPLQLVDLTAEGLARLGADDRLCSGDMLLAQRWSRALWQHPQSPGGILYRARHDPSRLAAAIFDRASARISAVMKGGLAAPHHVSLLADLLETYAFGLIDD